MRDWRTIPVGIVHDGAKTFLPFAGVYPTRWKIAGLYSFTKRRPDMIFQYLGKPSRVIAERLRIIMARSVSLRIEGWEFDRSGGLAYTLANIPGRLDFNVQDWTDSFRFYYPWSTGNAHMITTWCGRLTHRVPVAFQGKTCMIYSPYREEDIDAATWREHRRWLQNANLQLVKRQSILKNP